MIKQEEEKVFKLFNKDYLVIIMNGYYVDGPVKYMQREENEILFTTDVYSKKPLSHIDIDLVRIYKPINIMEE